MARILRENYPAGGSDQYGVSEPTSDTDGPEGSALLGRRAAVIGISTALSPVVTGLLLPGCLTVAVAPAAPGPPQEGTARSSAPPIFARAASSRRSNPTAMAFTSSRTWTERHHARTGHQTGTGWRSSSLTLFEGTCWRGDHEHQPAATWLISRQPESTPSPRGPRTGSDSFYGFFTCVGGDGIFVISEDGTGPRQLEEQSLL